MARSEQEKSEKRKGKKRKHEQPHASSTGSDDEVATKSLILEPEVAPRGEFADIQNAALNELIIFR